MSLKYLVKTATDAKEVMVAAGEQLTASLGYMAAEELRATGKQLLEYAEYLQEAIDLDHPNE